MLGRDPPAGELHAGDLAKAPPLAVPSDASLAEAAAAMEKAGVRRLLVVDEDGGVIGLVAAEDLMAAIAGELGALVRALAGGIEREKAQRSVASRTAGARPVFPGFGMAAMQ